MDTLYYSIRRKYDMLVHMNKEAVLAKYPQSKMIVVTGPSGVGKNTLIRAIMDREPRLCFAISATSREIRPGDIPDVSYYFFSPQDFQQKIDDHELVEYSENYSGKFYGTLWSEIDRIWSQSKIPISDIDVYGAQNLKKIFGDHVRVIFIAPPSREILLERLRNRATENEQSISERVARWDMELSFQNSFDAVVINDNQEIAEQELYTVVQRMIHE